MNAHFGSRLILLLSGIFIIFCSLVPVVAFGQARFTDIEVRYKKADAYELENKDAELMLDDKARRLRVISKEAPLDVSYDDIQKVVVDVNTHGKKAGFGASFLGMMAGGLLFGDLIATSIDKPFDNDHFVLLELKGPASPVSYVINVDNKVVPAVLKALGSAFGEKLVIPTFAGKTEKLEDAQFNPPKVKIRAIPTEKQHPLPEIRLDKATVIVTSPDTIMIRMKSEKKGFGILIYANGRLVSVVGPGDYTFFHLDAGEYQFVGDTPSPVGLRINLEAGKEYYLTLTPYAKGIRLRSFLSRHSREFVMFEVAGSRFMEWSLDAEKN